MERPSTWTPAAGTYLRLFHTIFENSFIWRPKRLVTISKFIYPSRLSILLKEFTSLCNVSQGCGPHPSALTPFVWLVAASDAEINLVLFLRDLLSFSPDLVSNRSAHSTCSIAAAPRVSARMVSCVALRRQIQREQLRFLTPSRPD